MNVCEGIPVANSPSTLLQPLNVPPPMTCEDEQVFLERHFETLQRASDGPSRQGTGASATARPSVVGPLGVSSATIDLMRVGSDKEGDLTRSSRTKDDKLLNKVMHEGIDIIIHLTHLTRI